MENVSLYQRRKEGFDVYAASGTSPRHWPGMPLRRVSIIVQDEYSIGCCSAVAAPLP